MKIARIKIQNILGITELEFEPGSITEIQGKNGSGKTSVLEAIKAVISPGHDATLLRHGETHGEAVIVLDDGTALSKTITASASDRKVTNAHGETIKKPATVIGALADLISVNPVEFLHAPAKDRARLLLETMPLEADIQRLQSIANDARLDKPIATGGKHALVVIDAVREAIYNARTGTNRAITEKNGTISQLEATLPPPSEADVGDASALLAKAAALDAAKDAEVARVTNKVAAITTEAESRIQQIRDAADVRLAELRRQIEAATERRDAEIVVEQASIQRLRDKASAQNAETHQKHNAEVADIKSQIATIQESAKQAARHGVTLDHINTHRGQLGALVEESEAQTAAIEQIDSYKLEMLSALPIPGLSVVDGDIVRDGITFDRLNEAQRVTIAIELAKLRAGDLKVVCCDGLECFDSATYDEFVRQANGSGLQFVITRVSDMPFSVSSSPITSEGEL
jgi:predicted ATP-dependent endonuclease of OLD family